MLPYLATTRIYRAKDSAPIRRLRKRPNIRCAWNRLVGREPPRDTWDVAPSIGAHVGHVASRANQQIIHAVGRGAWGIDYADAVDRVWIRRFRHSPRPPTASDSGRRYRLWLRSTRDGGRSVGQRLCDYWCLVIDTTRYGHRFADQSTDSVVMQGPKSILRKFRSGRNVGGNRLL